jgi:hypothetical protein
MDAGAKTVKREDAWQLVDVKASFNLCVELLAQSGGSM